MLTPLDVSPGDKFHLMQGQGPERFTATFVREKPSGFLIFDRVDRSGRYYVGREQFLLMRADGFAIKLPNDGVLPSESFAVEADTFEPELTSDLSQLKARKKYLKAIIQLYHLMCMDAYSVSASNEKSSSGGSRPDNGNGSQC